MVRVYGVSTSPGTTAFKRTLFFAKLTAVALTICKRTRLGRIVCNLVLADVPKTSNARDADNGAPAGLRFHDGEHVVAREVSRLEVHVDLRVPHIFGHCCCVAGLGVAHVGDEDVDASMPSKTGVDKRLDRLGRCSVCFLDMAFAT